MSQNRFYGTHLLIVDGRQIRRTHVNGLWFTPGAVFAYGETMTNIRSTAARVLATGEATSAEAQSLAGAVLGEDPQPRTARSLSDLKELLRKVDGVEGQTERANAIRAEMEKLK